MKRFGILLLTLLSVASCGITRRAPAVKEADSPAIPPLTDATEIAQSRQRAQAVMDSIDLVRSGAVVPRSQEGIRTATGVKPIPEAPKELVDEMLDYAKTFLGIPYRLGACGPDRYDCSGFTLTVFKEFGMNLPHNSNAQFRMSRPVESFSDLRKGDLVFFGARNNIREIGHVGIVVDVDLEHGMFRFIHASTSNGVEIQRSTQPYFMMRYMGAGRILPDQPAIDMYPKFILVSRPETPLIGTFVYGLVWNHKDLVDALPGYVKVHGGGWYEKDDAKKTITLYGGSGDYGEPKLSFLDRIPRELRDYKFFYTPIHGLPGNELDLSEVEWI